MTYKAVVDKGVVALPPDALIEDGTEVEVTIRQKGTTLGALLR